jgi:hypothetical protein
MYASDDSNNRSWFGLQLWQLVRSLNMSSCCSLIRFSISPLAKCIVIVQIFVAKGQPIDPLPEQRELAMFAAALAPSIVQNLVKISGQAKLPVCLT